MSLTESSREVVKDLARLRMEGEAYEAHELYDLPSRMEHNPWIADGRDGDKDYIEARQESAPERYDSVDRYVNVTHNILADGDLVAIKSHVFTNAEDAGRLFVDIWRLEGGKIAEHWDVIQPIEKEGANPRSVGCGVGTTYESAKAAGKTYLNPTCGDPDQSADSEANRKLVLESMEAHGALENSEIGRVIADGNFVLVHRRVSNEADPIGVARVDLFKVTDGQITDQWDVVQKIPEFSVSGRSMVVGPLEEGRHQGEPYSLIDN